MRFLSTSVYARHQKSVATPSWKSPDCPITRSTACYEPKSPLVFLVQVPLPTLSRPAPVPNQIRCSYCTRSALGETLSSLCSQRPAAHLRSGGSDLSLCPVPKQLDLCTTTALLLWTMTSNFHMLNSHLGKFFKNAGPTSISFLP